MGANLDLDDVVAGHPKAQQELDELRARVAELEAEVERVNKEWFRVAEQYNRETSRLNAERDRLREELMDLRSDLRQRAELDGGLMQHFYDRVCRTLEDKE